MAGIGTTLIVGASLGYRTVGVELESHFMALAQGNIYLLRRKMPQAPVPVIVQGDARRLTEVLQLADGAVCSPPYADTMGKTEQQGKKCDALRAEKGIRDHRYSGAVSSPPYSTAALSDGGGIAKRGYGPDGKDKVGDRTYQKRTHGSNAAQVGNLKDPVGDNDEAQIGNKNAGTYLSAMLQVYRELHAILKPGGVCCLVTKNPIKNGEIRRLDEDTIRLMEAAGFTLIERVRAMLTEELGEQMTMDGGSTRIRREHKSFFKRLHDRKRPDLAVDHEDVMFFRSV